MMAPRLSVAKEGTYFIDAQGKPTFWLGDTSWPLLNRYSEAEAKAYISRRAEQGFNVIETVFALQGHNAAGAKESTVAANPVGEAPWHDGPDHPNPLFFDYADELIQHANQVGVVLAIIPAWGYFATDEKLLNATNAHSYAKYIGDRFAARPNIVWMNGGDRLPMGCEDVWRAMAQGFKDSKSEHLITYHPTGSFCSSYFWQEEPWLDFNMIQTWGSWSRVYSMIAADRMRTPTKPTVMAEPAYEDGPEYPTGPITPLRVRQQAWWTFMAGGFFTYGQNQSWRMEPGWQASVDTPGAVQMGVFRKIAESKPWWKMVPDQSLLYEAGGDGRRLRCATRTTDGKHALIYLPEAGIVSICIDRMLSPRVKATWIAPRDGSEQDAGIHETENGRGKIFPLFEDVRFFKTPKFFEDSVLALDAID